MKPILAVSLGFAALVLLAAAPADAQLRGGIRIDGSAKQNTHVGRNTTSAVGGAKARTSIGVVTGGTQVRGRLNQNTFVGSNSTVASGKGAQADTEIGKVSDTDIRGTVKQNTFVGRNSTFAGQ